MSESTIRDLIRHVGCGAVDEFGLCTKCAEIRIILGEHKPHSVEERLRAKYRAALDSEPANCPCRHCQRLRAKLDVLNELMEKETD